MKARCNKLEMILFKKRTQILENKKQSFMTVFYFVLDQHHLNPTDDLLTI